MTALAPWALEASAVAALVLLLARPRSGPPLRSALLRLGLLKFALPPLLAWPLLPATAIAVVPGPDASPLAVVLAAVWVAGVIVVVARTAGERRALGALLRDAEPWTDRDGLSRLARLAADAGLARPPLALVSARAGAPLVGGWPRPALVLPRDWASGASAEDMELVLRHELAHLARRDLVWLELASWLAVVWWWNPLFHRVAARARAADEDACDDRALAGSRASAAEYGALLVRVAESGAIAGPRRGARPPRHRAPAAPTVRRGPALRRAARRGPMPASAHARGGAVAGSGGASGGGTAVPRPRLRQPSRSLSPPSARPLSRAARGAVSRGHHIDKCRDSTPTGEPACIA